MSKKYTMKDFVKQYKTFSIWDFTFREPTISKTIELKEFYGEAMKENMIEAEFYVWFLQTIIEKWDKEKLKQEVFEMPVNQATKFFFYVLEQLWLNFLPTNEQTA